MVLDISLLNTQQYKVRIKGKAEYPPLHLSVVAIEKEAFWSPSITVANLYIYIHICVCMCVCFPWYDDKIIKF